MKSAATGYVLILDGTISLSIILLGVLAAFLPLCRCKGMGSANCHSSSWKREREGKKKRRDSSLNGSFSVRKKDMKGEEGRQAQQWPKEGGGSSSSSNRSNKSPERKRRGSEGVG